MPAEYIHGTAPEEQERLALLNRLSNPPFLDFLEVQGGECVLEVGSGLGLLTAEVGACLPTGRIWGVELSAQQLAQAGGRASSNVAFCRGDAGRLPFRSGRLEVVYCRYLLEHVPDPERVLREMHRVLKPGGRALAQENNILVNVFYPECPRFDSLWRRFVELQAHLGGDALIGRRLLELFQGAGFREITLSIQPEVHWQGSPGFEGWVRNLIGNIHSAAAELVQRGLATRADIEEAVEEVQAFMRRPSATALFYWNRALGRK